MHKIGQSGGFLGRRLEPLLKTRLTSIGNVLQPLSKSLLIPLELTVAASATDAAIHKKMFRSGFTTLILYNEEMNGIGKIIKFLEESELLIKGVSETFTNEAKEQREGFLGIFLGTLFASLLVNLLTAKGTISTGEGTIRSGEKF